MFPLAHRIAVDVFVAPDWPDGIGRRVSVEIIRFRRCPTLRYFFHIYDDAETLDLDGMELPSIEAAVAMARHDLGQIVADELMHAGTLNTASRIDVAAEEGQLLASVRFDDLLDS